MSLFSRSAVSGVSLLLAFSFVSVAGAQEMLPASVKTEGAKLGLDQILAKLEQHNAQRAAELQEFDGKRVYRMQYHGLFKDRDAEMVVKVHFSAPDSKQFTIVSQNGSKFVIDHVFKKLLDAEQDATGDNAASARSPARITSFRLWDTKPHRKAHSTCSLCSPRATTSTSIAGKFG